MRIEKYSVKDLKQILRERLRMLSEYKDKVDLSRSHENVLIDGDGNIIKFDFNATNEEKIATLEKYIADIEKRIVDITKNPKTTKSCKVGSLVVTLPKSLQSKPKNEKIEFFKNTADFLRDRYGSKNVMGAEIHFDETSPHATFTIIPECVSRKTGKITVSAASKWDPKKKTGDFYTLHKDADKFMQNIYGVEGLIANGETVGKTAEEIKDIHAAEAAALKREREELERQKAEVITASIDAIKEAEEIAEEVKKSAEAEAKEIRKQADSYKSAVLVDIKKQAVSVEKKRKELEEREAQLTDREKSQSEAEADFQLTYKRYKQAKAEQDKREEELNARAEALDKQTEQLRPFAADVLQYRKYKHLLRDTVKLQEFLRSDYFALKPDVEGFIKLFVRNREELREYWDRYPDDCIETSDRVENNIRVKLKQCEAAAKDWEESERRKSNDSPSL